MKCGAAPRLTSNEPFRCTAGTKLISSSVILWKRLSRRLPALLTTASMRPKASSAVSTILCAPRPCGHAVPIRDSATALGLDLGDDIAGNRTPVFAGEADVEIVDDDRRSRARKLPRYAAPDAPAGAGDNTKPFLA